MSSRRPISQVVRDSSRRARNILKMTDPDEIARYAYDECEKLGMLTAEWRLRACLDAIGKMIVHRAPPKGAPDSEKRQLHLFVDCDEIPFNVRHDTGVQNKVLGDFGIDDIDRVDAEQDDNIKEAVAAHKLFRRAASFVKPLLKQHPSWVWRDAVAYMARNGGIPKL